MERFLVVAKAGELSLEEVVSYELSSFLPALFEARNVFRKADKPQLAHAISEYARDGILDFVPETERHVLDGGSLDTVEKRRKLWCNSRVVCRLHCPAIWCRYNLCI